jgi:hypothetical protein
MFLNRQSALDRRISSIQGHLRNIEREMGRKGLRAGRQVSDRAAVAGNQLSEAIGPLLSAISAQLRSGGRLAADEAADFGNEAFRVGARVGNDALQRITDEAEKRPLAMLAVAIGIGVFIGIVGRRR